MLSRLLSVTSFYEEKVGQKSRSADGAMRIVAKEIERDGVHGVGDSHAEDPPYVELLGKCKCSPLLIRANYPGRGPRVSLFF